MGYQKTNCFVDSHFLGGTLRYVMYRNVDIAGPGGLHAVLLNHGYGCDCLMWEEIAYVDFLFAAFGDQPLVVIAPDIRNSFGVDSADSCFSKTIEGISLDFGRYESWYVKELIPDIQGRVGVVKSWCIAGASMGGYVAVHLGLKYHPQFERIVAHHPVLFESWPPDLQALFFGDSGTLNTNDILTLIGDAKYPGLKLFMDCGADDHFKLFEGCSLVRDRLGGRGCIVENRILEGGHDRAYLVRHLQYFMECHTQYQSFRTSCL